MGSQLSIESEMDEVKELLLFLEKEIENGINNEKNKIIKSKIQEIEKIKDNKLYRDRSFLSQLFSSDPDLNSENKNIADLRMELKNTNNYDERIKFEQFKIECENQINILKKYYQVLINSKLKAQKREDIKQENFDKRKIKELEREEIKLVEKERVKALAAAHTGQTRQRAESIKNSRLDLASQKYIVPNCPYCGDSLGESPHADHIYPVSKGGLSTVDNMIYVCQSCNRSKGDKTLMNFIDSSGKYQQDVVIANLKKLKKNI